MSVAWNARKSRHPWWDAWWIAALALPMMVAADWKFRRRSTTASLGGHPDTQVYIELAVYGAVAAYLLLVHGKAPRLCRTSNLMFALWFFGATMFCSSLYAVYPTLAFARGTQFLIMCALAQTIATRARIDQLHRLAHAYLILMAGAIALGFVNRGHLNRAVEGRFHWLFVHPVPAGVALMCGVLIAAAYARSAELRDVLHCWPRWVYGLLLTWTGLALILTKTRGSLGGAFVGLAVLIFWHTKTRTKLDVGLMTVSVTAAIVALSGPTIVRYLERGQDLSKLTTLNERTNLWGLAWERFQTRPFQGYGLGASRGIFLEEIRLGGGHNAFINALVDTGLVGLTAFVAIISLVLWSLWHFRRGTTGYRDSLVLLPLMIGLIVNSMTAEFMAVPATTASMWMVLTVGWIGVLQRAEKSVRAANRGSVPVRLAQAPTPRRA